MNFTWALWAWKKATVKTSLHLLFSEASVEASVEDHLTLAYSKIKIVSSLL